MSDASVLTLLLGAWAIWTLANLSARVGRIADALEALRAIAERNRQ
ncbi:hypothetical protein [Sphingomonas sp. BK069]|nr:hypothetical protein [Sphingomonas sp. BK069]MBB3347352.1 hypothetical protein [Sphingomonas sp. BK069]